MALTFSPNPAIVRKIRLARKLSEADIAAASKLHLAELREIESGTVHLSKTRLFALADSLAVPVQFLFFTDVEIEPNLADYRTPNNSPALVSPSGLKKIERAKSILAYLDDETFESARSLKPMPRNKRSIAALAKKLDEIYISARNADQSVNPKLSFRKTRLNFEKQGGIVLCDAVKTEEFRGFCLQSPRVPPLLFINTHNQRPATKLFTLMHEIVHALIGASGVSDPGVLRNDTERLCNQTVARVMMPEEEFTREVRRLGIGADPRQIVNVVSRRFGASKQAVALRVQELGQENFYARWRSALPNTIPIFEEEDEDEDEGGGGGGLGAQISRFGYRLPLELGRAVDRDDISILDAYRLTNLKPATLTKLAETGQKQIGTDLP